MLPSIKSYRFSIIEMNYGSSFMLIFFISSEIALIRNRLRFDFSVRLRMACTKILRTIEAIVKYANPAIA